MKTIKTELSKMDAANKIGITVLVFIIVVVASLVYGIVTGQADTNLLN